MSSVIVKLNFSEVSSFAQGQAAGETPREAKPLPLGDRQWLPRWEGSAELTFAWGGFAAGVSPRTLLDVEYERTGLCCWGHLQTRWARNRRGSECPRATSGALEPASTAAGAAPPHHPPRRMVVAADTTIPDQESSTPTLRQSTFPSTCRKGITGHRSPSPSRRRSS